LYKQNKSHKIIIKIPSEVNNNSMNRLFGSLLLALFLYPVSVRPQYTDVINSNRPGQSVSAYALGKNVIQLEAGISYEQRDHARLSRESDIFGANLSLRYGLLLENLEINYEGTYENQDITFTALGIKDSRTDFSRSRLGLKYLIFDPYKDPERNKPNLYSWRANNLFQFRNLIPAVSVYAGANFVLGDNPFYPEDPTVSPRAMIATQSKLTPRMVLISNIAYDRIGTDFPEWSYVVSIQHAFRNPKWSVFLENEGIHSDRYSDVLLRSGLAHLFNKNFQADVQLGANFKSTPTRIFGTLGCSYRLDYHKDVPISTDSGKNIKRNSMKKKKTKKRKSRKKGKGAEDVILDPPR